MTETRKPAVCGGGQEQNLRAAGSFPPSHSTTVCFRGKVVMHVRNAVAYRQAGQGEMLLKPPAWSFHVEVLEQLERANVVHLHVTDTTTRHVYTVPFAVFAAFSVETNRGCGRQRYLPLAYWSVDGKPPARRPRLANVARQLEMFSEAL